MPAEYRLVYPERCGLWQPNNNGAYSAVGRGANRLTLPANWGQIASG